MQKPTRFLTPHRRARLIAWALAMLAWAASVMFGERLQTRRHMRERYPLLTLRWPTRLVCKLAMTRAAEIVGLRVRRRPLRNAAPAGFRRRTRPHALLRAIVGARLRRALKRGDYAQRLRFLIDALNDLDAFARRWFVPRALRGLAKLCAVVAFAPPAAAILSAPALAPPAADSS